MRASTRVIDRLITALLGLALLVVGGWLIAYRLGVAFTTHAIRRLRTDTIAATPEQAWWPAAVGAAGVVLVLGSLWLLVRHLRSAAPKSVHTEGGGTVDLTRVADAVAQDLEKSPLIRRARAATALDRGEPVIRLRVAVEPGADDRELAALARAAQHQITGATSSDVRLQVLVNSEENSPA